jgi:D-alanyl-lipoteichoic acid acyltransferase DltB (MBOAT superfamily)
LLFNSLEFLLFLPLVFALYWFVFNQSLAWQNGLILIASYFFYGWWSYKFLGLLILSTILDYAYGFWVALPNRNKAKWFLRLSIINNLGILAIFKYFNFFSVQLQAVLENLGWHANPLLLKVALPIGISFYTFHGMSYVFDIYRGKQKPVKNFVDYGVFVSFFPLLVAGPIERAHHLLPQIQRKRLVDIQQLSEGVRLILWGLFKKVVIADSLAVTVNEIFQRYPEQNGATLILGAIGFSFQIYGDFSGYSDIALGTAKLFGFELLSNFRYPYFSRNLAEFWRRWHISLSSWFRDYLYIPLGGSQQGKVKAVRNTFIIFLLSGFWHGANWTFIFWGLLHACGFLPLLLRHKNREHITDTVAQNTRLPSLKEFFQMTSTFLFVSFAWIFFRSDSLSQAWAYIQRTVFSIYNSPSQLLKMPYGASMLLYVIPFIILDWLLRRDERRLLTPKPLWLKYLIYFALAILVLNHLNFLSNNQKIDFIYFQF